MPIEAIRKVAGILFDAGLTLGCFSHRLTTDRGRQVGAAR